MHPTPPFDVTAMLDMARASTGLGVFGDPTFRDGLDALADALPHANLSPIGIAAVQGQLTAYLCERLRIEDWHARHPEIAAQSIVAPVFVSGLPRTGTTALSNLLAADPAARSLRFWESQRPTPPPEAASYWTDPRITDADAMLAGMKQAAPDLARMHDDTGTSPTENQDLLGPALLHAALRRAGERARLHPVVARLRHGARVPAPSPRAPAPPVALSARRAGT